MRTGYRANAMMEIPQTSMQDEEKLGPLTESIR